MKEKRRVIIVGAYGKMGKLLCEKLEPYYKILKVTEENKINDYGFADLIIDFSSASQSVESAKFANLLNIPIIIGATGQTPEQLEIIRGVSKNIPVLLMGNFSIGILIIRKIIAHIKGFFDGANPNITIIEKHHNEKKDSPSGTAILLKNEIQKNFKCDVSVLSERGGKEIGTHSIDIYFGDELISISHKAFSRNAFASGVLKSIPKIIDKKEGGLIDFDI